MGDHHWALLDDARQPLIDAFTADGVTRIEYVAAFPHLDSFSVWLCTVTDDQRDVLGLKTNVAPVDRVSGVAREVRVMPPVSAKVRTVLWECGFTEAELAGLLTVAQSQQTVDRDFKGSWFYATR